MLTKDIKLALKSKKAIIGYKKSLKFIKNNKPKMIIVANNIPEKMKEKIRNYAATFNLNLQMFEGSSKELGIICGKPYPVTTLVIKG
jgi:large subunit ribosomal protein L30e